MDDKKATFGIYVTQREGFPANLVPALEFLKQIPRTLQNSLKSHFKHSAKNKVEFDISKPLAWMEREPSNGLEVTLDKQLQAWKENPNWVDRPPKITVSIPKGSLCNLKVKFKVGLPPDAIYNIVTDPEQKGLQKCPRSLELPRKRKISAEDLLNVGEVFSVGGGIPPSVAAGLSGASTIVRLVASREQNVDLVDRTAGRISSEHAGSSSRFADPVRAYSRRQR